MSITVENYFSPDRLYNTSIFVSNTTDFANGKLCGITNTGIWMNKNGIEGSYKNASDFVSVECDTNNIIGQYVTLERHNNAREYKEMNICEVLVWGYQFEGIQFSSIQFNQLYCGKLHPYLFIKK